MNKFGEFYLKHLDVYSSEEIDERKLYYEEHAKKRGLPAEKDKLKDLKKDDLWSDEKESKIKDLEKFISSLRTNKSKFILKADIDSVKKNMTSLQL